jgi:hypothetical protein
MSRAESAKIQQPADVVVRPAIKHAPRSVVRDAHKRIARCGSGIVPVSSETEDKFEDAMEVTASSPRFEIARVLVCFDHVVSRIVNADHDGVIGCKLRIADCVVDCIRPAIPQPAEWEGVGNRIDAAMTHVVKFEQEEATTPRP